jgi:hypothetical protein
MDRKGKSGWIAVELSIAYILSEERSKLIKVNVDHRRTESVMNNVDDVWWCRTPKNTVVYGSGERRIRGQRRIALHLANHAPGAKKGEGAVGCLSVLGLLVSPLQRNIIIVASL